MKCPHCQGEVPWFPLGSPADWYKVPVFEPCQHDYDFNSTLPSCKKCGQVMTSPVQIIEVTR